MTADSPASEDPKSVAAASAEGSPRRIPIGTQRPGITPPKLPPRHQYVVPTTAGPETSTPAATAASAPEMPALSAGVPATEAAPAVPAESVAAGRGQQRPEGGAGGERRPRGERRGGGPKNAFPEVVQPHKRVAIPNLRSALEDDLESDFLAALEGVSVDDLLVGGGPAQAEAPLEPGTRIAGTVLNVGPDTAFIDLGGRRQGALKLAGLDGNPAVGEVLQLSVGIFNEEDGLYDVAPANRAVAVEDWSQLAEGMIVTARVTAANKGGLECEVAGLRGFMPASLVSTWRVENLEEMVGQNIEVLVTELVPGARRMVLSRRAVLEKQAADARTTMLETLEVGTLFEGIVRSVRDFGAFVDIGNGVEGLVHVSQLSWDRVANPADVLQPGQKISVVVKKIDSQTGKIALSARDTVNSPWKTAAEKYHVGATVRGIVSRIAQFGAFVKLEPGIEGLVHVSELAHRHVRSVGDVVKEGEAVECRVLTVDPDEQRLSLSIKALASAPAGPAASGADSVDDGPADETPPAAPPRRTNVPLKGGLGRKGAGEQFGLKW